MSDIYILFICIAVPQIFLLKLLDKRSRPIVLYEILGTCVCLLAANINGLIAECSTASVLKLTITLTPIVEEILKAIPVILYALFISDDSQLLAGIGMALGTGFAILENAYILLFSDSDGLIWALSRGFGSGLMHGLCTGVLAFGISKMDRDPKLLTAGIYSLIAAASIFHGSYNVLVQSPYKYVGFLLPLSCYLPFVIVSIKHLKDNASASPPDEE